MKRRTIALLLAVMLLASLLSACQKSEGPAAGQEPSGAVESPEVQGGDEENYETGDASLDDPRNSDGIGEDELLVVSFGTSFNDSRRLTVGAIEAALEKANPDWSVRRAFTSQIIIDHVKSRDGEIIDNVGEALQRAEANGVKRLVVQPTHLMNGYEYTDLVDELARYSDAFESVAVGEPLLTSDEDFAAVAKAITEATAEKDDGKTAIIFMGHGTEAASNGVYAKMQQVLTDAGCEHYYIGTVEATPSLDDVLAAVKAGSYEKVVLEPLMIVAGDHANNDMAGDEEGAWKKSFEDAGYQVECLIRGLGEFKPIQELFVAHAKVAVESLPAKGENEAAENGASETSMSPVDASAVADGEYDITVDSSSSMFRVVSCRLTAQGGQLSARMTLSGTGYSKLFLGTGEEAASAGEDAVIPYVENDDGSYSFTVPVPALNTPVSVAAFSVNKETWYDRELVFRADSLPAGALAEGAGSTVSSLALADGEYTVAVSLGGGSGRAGVESPARLTVNDGQAVLTLVWSSSNYDYMKIGGEKVSPVNTDGNSTFEIPVSVFDAEFPVIADTTAMSTPHEVEYTLRLDSSTITQA